eukprot:1433623-Amphidinium_carterae.3
MVVRIPGQVFQVDRYVLRQNISDVLGTKKPSSGGTLADEGKDVEMLNMKAVLQVIVQILLQDKMWGEKDPDYKTKNNRKRRDILVFWPGTAEICTMATTIECLVKGGYITAVRVYKINARVDQKALAEMGNWPRAKDWPHDTYASKKNLAVHRSRQCGHHFATCGVGDFDNGSERGLL